MHFNRLVFIFIFVVDIALFGCNNNSSSSKSILKQPNDSAYAAEAVLVDDTMQLNIAAIKERTEQIKTALSQKTPILLLQNLDDADGLTQIIAVNDTRFTKYMYDSVSKKPYLNEIFNIGNARPQDVPQGYKSADVYRIEMYNYALNLTTVGMVDLSTQRVISVNSYPQTQPDLNKKLEDLALQIAINSPSVIHALGFKPGEQDAFMAATKTSLNRTKCERSMHLCVAPTFVKDDKALWAIVDLTDLRLVGIRWTNVGLTGPGERISERKLVYEKIMECDCKQINKVERNGWKMNYVLTSSDGLRISEVYFHNQLIINNAKLVDWHVSYSGTDGFGYSDAVGCPEFSHAAVVAVKQPQISNLIADGKTVGFVIEQLYQSEQWPRPCNYSYVQRYEFYSDGKIRVAAANLGRGCGNNGTYRPVTRILFAGDQNNFMEWKNNGWQPWDSERWQLQNEQTKYAPEGYQYKIADNTGHGFFMEPGEGQFKDGGRGDNAFVYVTKFQVNKDEGETDMLTIGPCCNTDYHQGPEKFIEPTPENIQNSKLVVWYVPQLKNDDTKGSEYCWAESYLENGVFKTRAFPCMSGPMFVPIH
jgi:hypothetical protein